VLVAVFNIVSIIDLLTFMYSYSYNVHGVVVSKNNGTISLQLDGGDLLLCGDDTRESERNA
jgi:hypothetical protein